MNLEDADAALKQLRRDRPRGSRFVHQPVALVWAAERATRGEPRVARWRDLLSSVTEVVAALNGDVDDETMAGQVLGLRKSPLVDFRFSGTSLTRNDTARLLGESNPLLGLSDEAYQLLADRGAFEKFAKLAVFGLKGTQSRLILEHFGVFSGIGEVPGVLPGATFSNRAELAASRVHADHQAGISGNREKGAESIVISGGYEDDEDYGDLIIYTGHGGRDQKTRKQVADQSFDSSGNAALVTSRLSESPVRVVRGAASKTEYAPPVGLRYDGLFRVEKFWQERGRSGFLVCRYTLTRLHDLTAMGESPEEKLLPAGNVDPKRRESTVNRISREVALARAVKELHDHACQVCDTKLVIGDRGYAEAAHIQPLGRPHAGADTPDNLLCLCSNCHVLFDNGAIRIESDMSINSNYPNRGALRIAAGHSISQRSLEYHRYMFPRY